MTAVVLDGAQEMDKWVTSEEMELWRRRSQNARQFALLNPVCHSTVSAVLVLWFWCGQACIFGSGGAALTYSTHPRPYHAWHVRPAADPQKACLFEPLFSLKVETEVSLPYAQRIYRYRRCKPSLHVCTDSNTASEWRVTAWLMSCTCSYLPPSSVASLCGSILPRSTMCVASNTPTAYM